MPNSNTICDIQDNIYLGKWENIIPIIPSNSIDLIVTSPPYNVNLGNNKYKKDKYESYDDNMPYQDYLNWMEKLFYACNRVLKSGGRLCVNIGDGANGQVPTHADFTNILVGNSKDPTERLGYKTKNGVHYYSDIKQNWILSETNADGIEPFEMMTTIVWNKRQIGNATSWGSWMSPSQPSFPTPFEFIIVVSKGTLKHDGDKQKITVNKDDFMRNSRALWEFTPETQMIKRFGHPASFPEELPRRLIDQLTYVDDVILDPFSGSGTTCAVAKEMNRHYIGIEMSEKYYKTSITRLAEVPTMKTVIDKNGHEASVPEWMQ